MNKTLPLVVVVGLVGMGAGFLLRGQPQVNPASTEQAKAQLIQASMAPAPGEQIVHTFPEPEAMQAFVTLWQQRQERLLRMGLLEGYWNSDQATLNQINSQLSSQYQVDLSKRHVLNTEDRVLVEHEPPAAADAPAEAAGEAAAPSAEAPSEEAGKVVHTFADEDAMKAFAEVWQQRQSVLVRMAVLKAYWDSEKSLVDQLNSRLASDYQVDVTKLYALDEQRRVLIERPAPPTAQPAAETPLAGETPAQPDTPSSPGTTPPQTANRPTSCFRSARRSVFVS